MFLVNQAPNTSPYFVKFFVLRSIARVANPIPNAGEINATAIKKQQKLIIMKIHLLFKVNFQDMEIKIARKTAIIETKNAK
ncbi:hypothetical protein ACO0LG_29395 [Undibacterium sp. Ji42W]|uniref:hypothetical protein n=1 Tax=Undibacterium sp. Ji42W TaxID=3413039 RepID=UPI003BF35995